jgi:hypothetical protein
MLHTQSLESCPVLERREEEKLKKKKKGGGSFTQVSVYGK